MYSFTRNGRACGAKKNSQMPITERRPLPVINDYDSSLISAEYALEIGKYLSGVYAKSNNVANKTVVQVVVHDLF